MIWFLPTFSALSSASHDLIFLPPRYPVLQSHGKIHTSKHATPLPFPCLYALFPFTKLVPLPCLPALWHMSWNSFSCLHASLSLWSMNSLETRMMTPLLSSKTTVVPNTGQRLRKHQIDEWMGSRRILWSFNWSPLPSALLWMMDKLGPCLYDSLWSVFKSSCTGKMTADVKGYGIPRKRK